MPNLNISWGDLFPCKTSTTLLPSNNNFAWKFLIFQKVFFLVDRVWGEGELHPPQGLSPFFARKHHGCPNRRGAPAEKIFPTKPGSVKVKKVSMLNAMFLVDYFLTVPNCLLHVTINGPSKSSVKINQRRQPTNLYSYTWCISRKRRNQKQHSYKRQPPIVFYIEMILISINS